VITLLKIKQHCLFVPPFKPKPNIQSKSPFTIQALPYFNGAWISSNGEPRLPPATLPTKSHILGLENTSFEFPRIKVPPEGHPKIMKFKRPQKYLDCHIDNNIFLQ
jgi:hypothetical protein